MEAGLSWETAEVKAAAKDQDFFLEVFFFALVGFFFAVGVFFLVAFFADPPKALPQLLE